MRKQTVFTLLIFASLYVSGQSFVKVEILSGNSSTTCSDNNSGPDNLWGVNIDNEGYDYYAPFGFCQLNTPNLQYEESYPCDAILPDSVEVCFTALEFDGFSYCFVDGECITEICANFPIPDFGKEFFSLEIPEGSPSEGSIDFSIAGFTASTPAYDEICTPIDFGQVNIGDTLGDASLGLYHNHCTSNIGEIDTYPLTGWINNNGIWISFSTGAEVTPYIDIILRSDPENLGDPVSFQMASFFSDNDACTGTLDYFVQYYDNSDYDETMILNCIPPFTTFYILVDGVSDNPETLNGIFGLSIEAYDAKVAENFICDATEMGQVPEAGELNTLEFQVNRCADNQGEPSVPLFSTERTVWYTFVTPSSGNVLIEAFTDTLKEPIDLELALFSSSNDNCNGTLSLERSAYSESSFDEEISASCLVPNKRYWLMVDGETDNVKGAFKLRLSDMGDIQTEFPATAMICSGEDYEVGSSVYSASGVYLDTFQLANFCDSIVETTLTVLDPLSTSLIEIQEATALGFDDAQIELVPSGGSGVYSVLWENGLTSLELSGLIGGDTLCYTLEDDFGCSLEACLEVPYNTDIVPLVSLQEIDCFGDDSGVINIAAFNGVGPYSVTLVYPDGTIVNFILPTDNIGFDVFNLFAGVYNCTIEDVNGNINFDIDLLENDEIAIAVVNELPISCYGECDGLLEIEVSGGFAPYFYEWDTGGNQAEESNLCAGIYGLTVTDFYGCLNVFEILVEEPDSLDGFIDLIADVDCKGQTNGSLIYQTLDPDLSFEWSNSVSVALNENLAAGLYEITVSDAASCTKVLQAEVKEPLLALDLDFEVQNPISCFGESDGVLSSVVVGGNGSYEFDWQSGQQEALIFDLPAGTYTLTVTDAKDCSVESSIELFQPDVLDAEISKKDIACTDEDFGGRVDILNVSGGVEPYNYSIDGFYYDETNVFEMLGPGTYTAYLKDSNACIWSESIFIESPELITASLGDDLSAELGEKVSVNLFVNQSDISISWFYNGEELDCPFCTEVEFQPLESGVLEVEVLDLLTNCIAQDNIDIEIAENLDLYFPNSFSPNNDGINDLFYPFTSKKIRLVKSFGIFDRYGQELYFRENFQAGEASFGWNGEFQGRAMGTGVYTFIAVMEYINGKEVLFKGGITIVR